MELLFKDSLTETTLLVFTSHLRKNILALETMQQERTESFFVQFLLGKITLQSIAWEFGRKNFSSSDVIEKM